MRKGWLKIIIKIAFNNISSRLKTRPLLTLPLQNSKSLKVGNIWSNNYIEKKSNSDKNKILSDEEYRSKIRPYLQDIIYDLRKSVIWKIQLTIKINFISSKDGEEEHIMYSRSDNIETINDRADEVIKEIFISLKNRYKNNLGLVKER